MIKESAFIENEFFNSEAHRDQLYLANYNAVCEIINYAKSKDIKLTDEQIEKMSYSEDLDFYEIIGNITFASIVQKTNKEKHDNTGYIYFLETVVSVKIGKTINPKGRLMQLKNMTHSEITSFEYFKVNNMSEAESYLHKKYNDLQIKGEWFSLSEDDISEAKKIIEKSFK